MDSAASWSARRSGGLTLTCNDPGLNVCGGCTALTGKPGDPCGTCGALACSGTNALTCSDPGKNACGGCKTLTGTPGAACGTCGAWQCQGTDAVTCTEAKPAPGTVCGTCSTSGYVCSPPGKTVCKTPDDRTIGADIKVTGASAAWSSPLVASFPFAVAYPTQHDGQLVDATFVMLSRLAKGTNVGSVVVKVFAGVPGQSSTLLDTVSIAGDKVPSTASKVTFTFSKTIPALSKAKPIYFEISTDSTKYEYLLYGEFKLIDVDQLWTTRARRGWVAQQFTPYAVVSMLGCGL